MSDAKLGLRICTVAVVILLWPVWLGLFAVVTKRQTGVSALPLVGFLAWLAYLAFGPSQERRT